MSTEMPKQPSEDDRPNYRPSMGRGYRGDQDDRPNYRSNMGRSYQDDRPNYRSNMGRGYQDDRPNYRSNTGRGYRGGQANSYRGNWGRSGHYNQENGRQNPPTDSRMSHQNYAGPGFPNNRDYNGRGSFERHSNNYYEKMDDTSISRSLSTILRHTAEKIGLEMDKSGYVFVEDLLKLKRFSGVTVDDLQRVVSENDKQRFSMDTDESSQKMKIRANQGHSQKFRSLDLDLIPVDDPKKYPIIVHGTYLTNWEGIRKEGLKRMTRVHIHFAPGLPGEDGVISGMRSFTEVLIYLDLEKALKDGLEFFMSANKVILSTGDKNGIIAPKYFKKVVNRKLGNVLNIEESSPVEKKLPVGMILDPPKDKGANKKSNKNKKDKKERQNSTEMETSNPKEDNQGADEKKFKKFKHQDDPQESSTAEVKTTTEVAEKPEEKQAEKPKEKGAEKPKEKGAEKPKEKGAEKPKEKGAEKPKEKGAEKPKEKGAEKPKEKGTEKPKENPIKNTIEKTVKKLTDNADEGQEEKISSSKENESTKSSSQKKRKPAPKIYLIENAEDEKLDKLKDEAIFAVHTLTNEKKIVYVLISQPGSVLVFNRDMKEFLKPLLENKKSQKVMFDYRLNDEISEQLDIMMYEKPVADVQVLFSMSEKRRLVTIAEIIGEACEKLAQPNDNIIDVIAEKIPEKSKIVKKTLTQVAELVPLYEKYKSILDSEDGTSPDKYNNLNDDTKNKISRIFGESKAVVGGAGKE